MSTASRQRLCASACDATTPPRPRRCGGEVQVEEEVCSDLIGLAARSPRLRRFDGSRGLEAGRPFPLQEPQWAGSHRGCVVEPISNFKKTTAERYRNRLQLVSAANLLRRKYACRQNNLMRVSQALAVCSVPTLAFVVTGTIVIARSHQAVYFELRSSRHESTDGSNEHQRQQHVVRQVENISEGSM